MQCEVCGGEIRGKPVEVVVEGSEIKVCQKCKRFGMEVEKWKPYRRKISPEKKTLVMRKRSTPKIEIIEEVIPDFNMIIKRERERRNWTQEKFAKKINEKVSLIGKIERGEMVPEPKVLKKIEQLFNIKLTERIRDIEISPKGKEISPTLGDIAVIRKK
jgi:putative transcription factor